MFWLFLHTLTIIEVPFYKFKVFLPQTDFCNLCILKLSIISFSASDFSLRRVCVCVRACVCACVCLCVGVFPLTVKASPDLTKQMKCQKFKSEMVC